MMNITYIFFLVCIMVFHIQLFRMKTIHLRENKKRKPFNSDDERRIHFITNMLIQYFLLDIRRIFNKRYSFFSIIQNNFEISKFSLLGEFFKH